MDDFDNKLSLLCTPAASALPGMGPYVPLPDSISGGGVADATPQVHTSIIVQAKLKQVSQLHKSALGKPLSELWRLQHLGFEA